MFTGNPDAVQRNPTKGMDILWIALAAVGGVAAYRALFGRKKGAGQPPTEPPAEPPAPPAGTPGVSTLVNDPVKGRQFTVRLPNAGTVVLTRENVGLGATPPVVQVGSYVGFIVTWPSGAEMLWGRVMGVAADGKLALEIEDYVPYDGASHDVRPVKVSDHQISDGASMNLLAAQVLESA